MIQEMLVGLVGVAGLFLAIFFFPWIFIVFLLAALVYVTGDIILTEYKWWKRGY